MHYGPPTIIDGATAVPSIGGGLHGQGLLGDVGLAAFDLQQLLQNAQAVAGSEFGQRVLHAAQEHGPAVAQTLVQNAGDHPEDTAVAGFRIAAGGGGWTYQQDADGAITILAVPSSEYTSSIGRKLTSGTAWTAITNEIGPFPMSETSSPTGASASLIEAYQSGALQIPDFRPGSKDGLLLTDEQAKKATTRLLAAAGTAAAGAAAGTSAGGAALVGTLLASAGVQASVPVVGWITAAGTAAVAGSIALVRGVRKGKATGRQITKAAVKLGLDKTSAAQVPMFVKRVSKMPQAKRDRIGARLMNRLDRKLLGKKRRGRIKAKLAVLAASDLVERAAKAEGLAFALNGMPNPRLPVGANQPLRTQDDMPRTIQAGQPVNMIPNMPRASMPNVPAPPRAPPAYGQGYVGGAGGYHLLEPSAWVGAPAEPDPVPEVSSSAAYTGPFV